MNGRSRLRGCSGSKTQISYQFEFTMNNETEAKRPVRDVVKKELVPLLRKKFANFSADLIKGKDLDMNVKENTGLICRSVQP